MDEFVDILEPRRKDLSTVAYFLKGCEWKHTYQQNTPTNSFYHKICVLKSRKIEELIEKVSRL